MKNKELIEHLSKLPLDLEVIFSAEGNYCEVGIPEVAEEWQFDPLHKKGYPTGKNHITLTPDSG